MRHGMIVLVAAMVQGLCAQTGTNSLAAPQTNTVASGAIVSTIAAEELEDFENQPAEVKALIEKSLELTRRNLKYRYGSADPNLGGMDCSGTIYYLLTSLNIEGVPRPSDEMYRWVWEKSVFHSVSGNTFGSFEFSKLKSGDLLFWVGTYSAAQKRDPPVSHVMLYLGREKKTGKPVMMGASEGRRYANQAQYGVSVFDFVLPKPREGGPRFIGYGPVPGLVKVSP